MNESLRWFHEARYGMFIHWGPYSVAGRGEWVLNRERIPYEEYTRLYVDRFLAESYDPMAWATLAKEAGMGYVVLTTRHHDGFALWDTKTTDFNAVKLGPKRDLIRPFVEAVRDAGLKVGFYFSVADWKHPDYPGAYYRDWPCEWRDEASRKRFIAYYQAQLEELMTQYGKIDMLWYDGCVPGQTDGERVNARVKELQPDILINRRNGGGGDFHVSEQAIKPAEPGVPWEACMTLNENWGYHPGDHNYKSAKDVIRMLTETAAGAGNLLLNVGPKPDGTIPKKSRQILLEAGDWLRRNRAFLAHSERSPFSWHNSGQLTVKGNCVYLHLFHSPGKQFCLAEIANKINHVRLLETGQALPFEQAGDRLFIKDLPDPLEDPIATTIVIEVEGELRPVTKRTTFWIPG